MEFAKPVHQLDFARSRIDDSICHQHRRCADEADSIWPPFSASPNVYVEPIESNKVVKEKNDGGNVLADNMDRLLCFEYKQNESLGKYQSDKQHGTDCHLRCEKIKGISKGLACLDGKQNHHLCHVDLKSDNGLLDEDYPVAKLADVRILRRRLVKEERTPTKKSCMEKPRSKGSERIERNVFLIIALLVWFMIGLTETVRVYWSNRIQPTKMWIVQSSSKQIKRLNQIVLSCLETGKSSKATGCIVSPIQQAAFDVLILGSGAVIGAMVHIANIETLPAPYTARKMYSVVLVLTLVIAIDAALCMLLHLFWSNQTEERSDRPRTSRASATNPSDKTTNSSPVANKLTNNEVANHSDPNSSVAERDRTAEENKRPGGIWFIATGAAHHATGNPDLITNLVELESDALRVHAADGTPMPVRGRGNVVTEEVVLPDVYYVPGLCANLVSVGQLAGMDYCVGFGRGACVVSDAAGTVIGRAHARADGLYVADFLRVPLGGTP